MFAKPRTKKSLLPPPNKKRRASSAVEEITFDNDARQEYLTGFHKRKLQRVKHAQEEAAKKAREEKLEARKQMRQDRQREVEEHVESVNRMLRESGAVTDDMGQDSADEVDEEWGGFPDRPNLEILDHEEEYLDEDRYTTVTIESVSVSREGLGKISSTKEDDAADGKDEDGQGDHPDGKDGKPTKQKKKPKKKFRYETKLERQLTERKRRAKGRSRHQA